MTRTSRPTPQGRRALVAACHVALAVPPAQAAEARLGDLDPSFDADGVATPDIGALATLRAVAVRPDGAPPPERGEPQPPSAPAPSTGSSVVVPAGGSYVARPGH